MLLRFWSFVSRYLIGISGFVIVNAAAQSAEPINFAFLSADTSQIEAISDLVNAYESEYPNSKVNLVAHSDATYKKNLKAWMAQGSYDIMHWQAGDRLKQVIQQQLIVPIDTLIPESKIRSSIAANVVAQVEYNNAIYALPFAQYPWGFYYNKDIFKRLGLVPPKSREDLLKVLQTIKNAGIPPLVQAANSNWESLAWLDFVTLAIGGETLRNKVLFQKVLDDTDKKELDIYLKQLFESDFFFAADHKWEWQQAIFVLMREQAAMTLTGEFAENLIPASKNENIGFFPFPGIASGATIAPMDLFVVPAASKRKNVSKQFLAFLSRPDIRDKLAADLGWSPVNINPQLIQTSERTYISSQHLQGATKLFQYFDREAEESWSVALNKQINHSIKTGNITGLKRLIEAHTAF